MTGKSHTDGAEGEAFGLEVMQRLNDKCAQWKHEIINMDKAIIINDDEDFELDVK